MSIAKVSIQRPLLMIMVIMAILLFGFSSWRKLPVDSMPKMDLPYVMVQITYPGAGPEEIELNVVKRIEEEISTVSGIKNMTSYCNENSGAIVLEFNANIKADMAAIEVKDKVSQILYLLPDDVKEPVVMKFDFEAEAVITLALLGDSTVSPLELRRYADKRLKDQFSRVEGVAIADVSGGREREIHVTLNPEKLAAHNLSVFNIYPVFIAQNALIPAGYVTGKYKEYAVTFDGQFYSVEEIGKIQIPAPGGYNVRLNEIAKISDSYADVRGIARFKRMQSVEIAVTKSGDANTVAVAKGVLKVLKKMREELPPEMKLEIVEDKSIFINNSIADTYSNIWQGILLTAIILLIFLSDFRLTVIAAITMPASLIMGFIGMEAMGFSMNMVTMMALSIVVGILVTNSIVVLENIVRHKNMGKDPHHAAMAGTDEIFVAVLASTLTNLAVFIPIASTSGTTGAFFKELGLTIVFSTVASLFLSFTLVPLMAAYILKPHAEGENRHIIDKWISQLDGMYENMLDKILKNRLIKILIVAFTFLLLFVTMKFVAPTIGIDFMPKTDEGFVLVFMELPVGTPLHVTQVQLHKIENRLKDLPYLKAMSSSIGGARGSSGVQNGRVRLEFVPLAQRDLSVFDLVKKIRPLIADIPDARITVMPVSSMSARATRDVEIQIMGENMDTLSQLAMRALEVIRSDSELTDFNSSWKGTKPEILVKPKRDIMEHYGLNGGNIAASVSAQVIGGLLRYNITGEETAKYRENGEEYPIRVRLEEHYRKDIRDVATMTVMTPKGPVPLEALADVKYSQSVSRIIRRNKLKMLNVVANLVSSDIAKGTKTPQVFAMLNEKAPLPDGYFYKAAGNQEDVAETTSQLILAASMAVILTLMLLIALLESIPMGIVIFMTLPLGLIGVVWALFITRNSLSMISMLSIIMLIGVVVNNAILMIDYARQLRNQGHISPHDAIVKAAGGKLKAILMSNIAIVVSMIPMALGLGSGGTFRAPFAITAIGGVIVSTILTFFVIPVLYIWTAPKHEDEVL